MSGDENNGIDVNGTITTSYGELATRLSTQLNQYEISERRYLMKCIEHL